MKPIEEQLKELILDRYGSVREFTLKIGMPYSTLATIFTRGIDNANIKTIKSICKELHISVDALADHRIQSIVDHPTPNTIVDLGNTFSSIKQIIDEYQVALGGDPLTEGAKSTMKNALDVAVEITKKENKK